MLKDYKCLYRHITNKKSLIDLFVYSFSTRGHHANPFQVTLPVIEVLKYQFLDSIIRDIHCVYVFTGWTNLQGMLHRIKKKQYANMLWFCYLNFWNNKSWYIHPFEFAQRMYLIYKHHLQLPNILGFCCVYPFVFTCLCEKITLALLGLVWRFLLKQLYLPTKTLSIHSVCLEWWLKVMLFVKLQQINQQGVGFSYNETKQRAHLMVLLDNLRLRKSLK